MQAKMLISILKARPDAEVYIHDEATGDDLPIGSIDLPYKGPVVLHVKGESE